MAKKYITIVMNGPSYLICNKCHGRFRVTEMEVSAEEELFAMKENIPVDTAVKCTHCGEIFRATAFISVKKPPQNQVN